MGLLNSCPQVYEHVFTSIDEISVINSTLVGLAGSCLFTHLSYTMQVYHLMLSRYLSLLGDQV